jgi:hypothetical protein
MVQPSTPISSSKPATGTSPVAGLKSPTWGDLAKDLLVTLEEKTHSGDTSVASAAREQLIVLQCAMGNDSDTVPTTGTSPVAG